MNKFTNEEQLQIVVWHTNGFQAPAILELFHKMFPDRPLPTRSIIARIMNNLHTHGCFSLRTETTRPPKRPPRPNPDRELHELMVCAAVEENPARPTRDLARELGKSSSTVADILRRNGYRSFRPDRSNETFPCDEYSRMEFCEAIVEKINGDERFLNNVLFTSDSSFSLGDGCGSTNSRCYWSRGNRKVSETPQKLHVWAGILGDSILGPYFVEGNNLHAQTYLKLLKDNVIPALRDLGVPLDSIWFQQDGRPAHNAAVTKKLLTSLFPGRVIAGFRDYQGDCEMNVGWPVRSPDLAPCDFFLWKYVKSKIYAYQEEKLNNFNELRAKIADVLSGISPEILQNVRINFYNRLGYCLAQNGGRFEYLL